MYYDALSRNTVKITLTKKDMSDYSIRSESLRSRTAESKRTLTRFLKQFQSESALFKGQNAERLFLEAFPSEDGGCVMYVSTLGMEPLPPQEPEDIGAHTLMCVTGELDSIVKLCAAIEETTGASALYRFDGSYCLVLHIPSDMLVYSARMISEYGELSEDETDIACAEEHGEVICGSNAASVMAGLA